MRKFLLMACVLFGFMACTQNPIEEQTAIRVDAPETIKVGFEDDETRIQLNEAQKTVWTKEDLVSVFYCSDANQKWQYQGETGERVGNLKRVEDATATTQTTKTVVVYPYSKNYWLNTDNYAIDATLPATQHYAAGSYGVGSNLMVSQSEFTQFSLKSVCGWLKLQLTGNGEVVKSIKFSGNNGEQVAGLIYVDTETAEATLALEMGGSDNNNAGGNLVFDDTIITEVTLDCGEGVELGAEATPFYISLPPQTFANGFTVDIECEDYELMTLTTEKEVVIERNHIQPMVSVEHNAEQIIPNNEIWYTNGSTTEATTPCETNVFGANIVSNTYDAAKECWVIKFDGEVTTIGDWAFFDCRSLTSVTIPDSVTIIGNRAFYNCSSLTSVTIGDSVTSIGNYAFDGCYNLTSVTIGDSVTTIGDYAFYDCSRLTSVTIPDSLTTIGDYAFLHCYSLTSVTIPDSVTTIGDYAFLHCYSLTSVTIGDSVTEIGWSAFEGCSSLTSVIIGDSVTTIGTWAFARCNSLTSVTIPDSVTTIGDEAFYNCTGELIIYSKIIEKDYSYDNRPTHRGWLSRAEFTKLTIGDGIEKIGDYAFYNCNSLTSVTIPDSVTTIGEEAFYDCSLTSVYISDIAAWCNISFGHWFYNPFNLYLHNELVTDLTIPDSVTTIGDRAFRDCSNLTSVTIPDSVTTIGDYAFYGCSSLTSVTIGDSVTTIGNYAFENCDSLKSVTIPDSVTTIEENAFRDCSSLTSVTIGNSVTTIGNYAFRGCSSLTSVTIPDSVTTIGHNAFYKCINLTSVTIGDSVTTIGDYAFLGCSSLTSVTIPDSVTEIGKYAFAYCYSLTSVTIGDSVTTIGDYAFQYCSSLTSVAIPDSVTSIAYAAFQYCTSLTNVTIPDSVTTIGGYAFEDCSSLTSVTIGDSVTTIGEWAFRDCSSLSSVYCKATTPPAGDSYMFYNNASGRKIYVPMESVDAYKSASYWSDYRSYIVGYYF